VDEFMVVPFPSWPEALLPQHFAVPFANNAHECELPADSAGLTVREAARGATAPAGATCETKPPAINATASATHRIPIRVMTAPLRTTKVIVPTTREAGTPSAQTEELNRTDGRDASYARSSRQSPRRWFDEVLLPLHRCRRVKELVAVVIYGSA
jgi:hypothetical protein